MKTATYLFLTTLVFSLVKESIQSHFRKLDENDASESQVSGELMKLIGFGNYAQDAKTVSFKIIFRKLGNITFDPYLKFNTSITYLKNNDESSENSVSKGANCTKENLNLNEGYASYNCIISIIDISNINIVEIGTEFTFLNKSLDGKNYSISVNEEIMLSDLAENSMNNILNDTKELFIFNLNTDIKPNYYKYILNGKMHKNLIYDDEQFEIISKDINGTLKCQNKNNFNYECLFSPTSKIDKVSIDNLDLDSKTSKIYLIVDEKKINKEITFPSTETGPNKGFNDVNVLSVGNFQPSDNKENAKGKIYFKGPLTELINLQQFIQFFVNINYTPKNLRILEENVLPIEVKGEKNNTELSNGLVSYDITYLNTTNKTILNINSPSIIKFSSENNKFNETEINMTFSSTENYDFTETIVNIPKVINLSNKIKSKSESFSFDFTGDNEIMDTDEKTAYISYIPYNENRSYSDCNIIKVGKLNDYTSNYTINCKPKRSIYAPKSSLKIDILNINENGRRLRSTNFRTLQGTGNTTLFPNGDDTDGYIDYTYDPRISTFIPKKNDSGLSGGAIAAIIIASIVAILAVVFLIFWFNRPIKPAIKNDIRPISANSSASVNN